MKKIMLLMLITSPCFAAEPNMHKQEVRFQQQIQDPQFMLPRVVPQQHIVGLMAAQVVLGHNNIAGTRGEKTKYPRHTNQGIIPKNQKFPKLARYRLQQSRGGH